MARSEPPRLTPVPNLFDETVRVLLIEDNPADVILFQEALAASGTVRFELGHASRLADARSRLSAESFDLVITDLGLPDSQGLETYRQVRNLVAGLPVIVLTGLDDDATGMHALREGAHDYLVKGQVTPRTLARAARYAIEKKQHQEELRQAQKLEAVGRLAAGIAHDFNNILSIVRGNAESLATEEHSEEVLDSAREILEATDRATALARQLLTFSRQQAMNASPLDLNRIIGDFTRMLRRLLGESVQLELQLAAELPCVLADTGMIEQVLLNLAVNARDAMPGGGKLRIQTATVELTPAAASAHPEAYAGRFSLLTVSDTGAGMTPEVLARIFEPFFSTKPLAEGTGLGLATVHGIVQQHRGWLKVTSRLGAGTSFDVFLPSTSAKPAPIVAPTPRKRGTETILLVEDEPVLRKLMVRVLKVEGYEVLEAGSGAEARAVWAERADSIDLLLTDMVLPGDQTGRQLAEALAQARPGLEIIFTSGYSPDFTAEGFTLQEGVNFLRKPYPLAELVRAVRERLDKPLKALD